MKRHRDSIDRLSKQSLVDLVREIRREALRAAEGQNAEAPIALMTKYGIAPLVKCEGQAHEPGMGHIDNCGRCAPNWGVHEAPAPKA